MKTALRKIFKSMFIILILVTLVFSVSITVFASDETWNYGKKVNYVPFNGESYYTPSDWSSNLVNLYQLKWYENPNNQVLKGEFMLVQLRTIQASLTRQGISPITVTGGTLDYKDIGTLVPSAREEAKILKALGILTGTQDNYMRMADPITRSQAAKVITYANDRVLKIPSIRSDKVFYDTVNHWAESYISYAYQIGLMNGVTDTNFYPDGALTIEQTLQILENEIGYYGITRTDVAKAMNETFKITLNPNNIDTSTEAITLNKNNITLQVGNSEMIYATITPSYIINKTVTWTSSNNLVATVNSYGMVSGIGNGTAVITARTINGVNTSLLVTVNGQVFDSKPSSITITSLVSTLKVGEGYQFSATILPYNAINKTVSWVSSDTSIAKIDSNGYLTAIGGGTAVIIAVSSNGLETYTTVIVDGSGNVNNGNITQSLKSLIYVQGYSTSSYYNAFSNEDITFVIETKQLISSINFSNTNTVLTQNVSATNNGYIFKVKTADLKQNGETQMTVNLSNNETLTLRICIYQR